MPKDQKDETKTEETNHNVAVIKDAALNALVTVIVTAVAGGAVGYVATKVNQKLAAKKASEDEEK